MSKHETTEWELAMNGRLGRTWSVYILGHGPKIAPGKPLGWLTLTKSLFISYVVATYCAPFWTKHYGTMFR